MSSNVEIKIKNKQELRTLEGMYVNNQIDNLNELVVARKEQLTDELEKYQEECTKIVYAKDGTAYPKLNINPYVMQHYFFKSINPIGNREPAYSAEKLSIVWELYQDIVCQVNIKIGDFTPTLTSFCTFAGITLETLRKYKKSADQDMRVIVEKINDMCFDTNISMAQIGKVKERSTIYRMKSEQEKAEKEQPQIHLHEHNEKVVDFDELNKKLAQIQGYHQKKSEIIEVQKNE